ncbi:glycerophosphodiester phosphodiesterase family protein [Roseovarius sp. MMSF_3281]|uniref:glycerophosphodiester phosphodiesterase family protein n=1 Tax=Roseovarius sp. MMSF_3281 TaxID=3046694 RepID=UPI00273E846B|nr:glycerophosphodiester phosphodiesterase family protein [Roseovarius sp. MMSF_3281]
MTRRLPDAFRHIPLAHRALHDKSAGRPENSRAAIMAAVSAGYGIEIDVQPSQEGCAMVFHDYDMARLTGERGPIQQRRVAELAQVPLLGGDEGVPTLAQVLELVGGKVPLLIELKDQHGQMGATDGRLEASVADAVKGYGGPVAVMSFNPEMVARLAGLIPDVPRGLTTAGFSPEGWGLLKPAVRARLREIPDYDRVGASFISHEVADLDSPKVAGMKARGADILCWTVKSRAQEQIARQVACNITFEGYLPDFPA